jgi:hypothetical protein
MQIHSPIRVPIDDRTAELDRLGDEIAELAAHLDAATARLLGLIREFDARGGWGNGFGRAGTAEHVERIVRGSCKVDRQAEAREAAQRHRSRALHVYRDEDGMVVLRGWSPKSAR